MHTRTKIIASVGPACTSLGDFRALMDAGAEGVHIDLSHGGESVWTACHDAARRVEREMGCPLAIVASLPEAADASSLDWVAAHEVDFLILPLTGELAEAEAARRALAERDCAAHVTTQIDCARELGDLDRIVRQADAVTVTRAGLAGLDYAAGPIAQKSIARQCQIGAKPCIVARDIFSGMSVQPAPFDNRVFDMANVVFDHADAVTIATDNVTCQQAAEMVQAASKTLLAAESFLEVTDRPLKVGFGQPPNTAALAYAIRHILKIQEIAAVAVYSVTGATAALISKNWIDAPILAFSADSRTARRMCLYHGVISRHVAAPLNTEALLETAGSLAKDLNIAQPGDRIIVVSGHPVSAGERANGFVVEVVD